MILILSWAATGGASAAIFTTPDRGLPCVEFPQGAVYFTSNGAFIVARQGRFIMDGGVRIAGSNYRRWGEQIRRTLWTDRRTLSDDGKTMAFEGAIMDLDYAKLATYTETVEIVGDELKFTYSVRLVREMEVACIGVALHCPDYIFRGKRVEVFPGFGGARLPEKKGKKPVLLLVQGRYLAVSRGSPYEVFVASDRPTTWRVDDERHFDLPTYKMVFGPVLRKRKVSPKQAWRIEFRVGFQAFPPERQMVSPTGGTVRFYPDGSASIWRAERHLADVDPFCVAEGDGKITTVSSGRGSAEFATTPDEALESRIGIQAGKATRRVRLRVEQAATGLHLSMRATAAAAAPKCGLALIMPKSKSVVFVKTGMPGKPTEGNKEQTKGPTAVEFTKQGTLHFGSRPDEIVEKKVWSRTCWRVAWTGAGATTTTSSLGLTLAPVPAPRYPATAGHKATERGARFRLVKLSEPRGPQGPPFCVELPEDRYTRGDWDRHYGARMAVLCGRRSPLSVFCGIHKRRRLVYPIYMQHYLPWTGDPNVSARAWHSTTRRSFDNRTVLWNPADPVRRDSIWDDYGETLPLGETPGLGFDLPGGRGMRIISLYFNECDWIQYRSHQIRIYDRDPRKGGKPICETTVSDQYRGVYKRFLVWDVEQPAAIVRTLSARNSSVAGYFGDLAKEPLHEGMVWRAFCYAMQKARHPVERPTDPFEFSLKALSRADGTAHAAHEVLLATPNAEEAAVAYVKAEWRYARLLCSAYHSYTRWYFENVAELWRPVLQRTQVLSDRRGQGCAAQAAAALQVMAKDAAFDYEQDPAAGQALAKTAQAIADSLAGAERTTFLCDAAVRVASLGHSDAAKALAASAVDTWPVDAGEPSWVDSFVRWCDAMALPELGVHAAALAQERFGLELPPYVLRAEARMLARLWRWDEAADRQERLIARWPKDKKKLPPFVYANLATYYRMAGDKDRAQAVLARSRDPRAGSHDALVAQFRMALQDCVDTDYETGYKSFEPLAAKAGRLFVWPRRAARNMISVRERRRRHAPRDR